MRGVLKNGIYTKTENEKNKLLMGGGAWSINLDELPGEVQLIEYITPTERYVISMSNAVQYGFIRMLGGEKKLVVPLKHWSKGAIAINDGGKT